MGHDRLKASDVLITSLDGERKGRASSVDIGYVIPTFYGAWGDWRETGQSIDDYPSYAHTGFDLVPWTKRHGGGDATADGVGSYFPAWELGKHNV